MSTRSFLFKNMFFILFKISLYSIVALAVSVIGLASFGASLGLRRMYVKALLKIFEYATNIKEEKLKDSELIETGKCLGHF